MSIVIAMQFGAYALLCTDTRMTFVQGAKTWKTDEVTKVHRWQYGIITGSGLSNLLDPVVQRMQDEAPASTLAMEQIIKEEREALREDLQAFYDDDDIDAWFATTGWFVTYSTMEDDQPVVRLGIFHPSVKSSSSDSSVAHFLLDNAVMVITPAELGPQACATIQQAAERAIKPISDFPDVQSHYEYHVSVCAQLVRVAAKVHESVNERIRVGIHTVVGHIQISDVIDCATTQKDGPAE